MRRVLVPLVLALVLFGGACAVDEEEEAQTAAAGDDSGGGEEGGDADEALRAVTTGAAGSGGAAPPPPPSPAVDAATDNRSTFALDVDTGSYTLARRYLNDGLLPDAALVRTEELVNFFDQSYAPPATPGFAVHVDATTVPFLPAGSRVVRVGLQAWEVAPEDREAAALTFVVDVSGSMAEGEKLELVKASLTTLVGALRPDDTVGIVAYSEDAWEVLVPTAVGEGREAIVAAIGTLQPLGGTNAEAGLRLGYDLARRTFREGAVNRVVLASDGVANVGAVLPEQILAAVAEDAGKGIQLVTVGVGLGVYNDPLLEQLADQGDGFYAYVDGQREAERLFVHDLTGTLQTVAMDAKVQVEFDPALVESYRLLGFENRDVADDEFRNDDVDGGEIGAGHTVTALYEVQLAESAAGDVGGADGPLGRVRVRWADPESRQVTELVEDLAVDAVVASFEEADPRLQLDVLVAAGAEAFRGGPWSQHLSLQGVADNAPRVGALLADDPAVAEWVQLTQRAATLA